MFPADMVLGAVFAWNASSGGRYVFPVSPIRRIACRHHFAGGIALILRNLKALVAQQN
jgi:hypothetical protein